MELKIDPNGIWYHGSNMVFSELREGSTITQWKELAEAFSHQPDRLSYDDDGTIYHNGMEKGYFLCRKSNESAVPYKQYVAG